MKLLDSIPDEAFKNLESLKKHIKENVNTLGKLVIKCKICECNTRAKVIMENHFVSISASTLSENAIDKVVDVKLCTNCEEALHAIRYI